MAVAYRELVFSAPRLWRRLTIASSQKTVLAATGSLDRTAKLGAGIPSLRRRYGGKPMRLRESQFDLSAVEPDLETRGGYLTLEVNRGR